LQHFYAFIHLVIHLLAQNDKYNKYNRTMHSVSWTARLKNEH